MHLKSDDFFNAAKYPKLTLKSTDVAKNEDGECKITRNLTIQDITKEVTLDVIHGGTVEDPYGNTKAGFEISGTIINRKEFGLTWSAVTEADNVVVGDEIRLQ